MGLSRLDNFLKSVRGTVIYVDPNSLDATDSIENQGNSLTRPFKTIQWALIEVSRFSYQKGLDNDRFAKTTVMVYPGEHTIDNRPGWIPIGANNYRLRDGSTSNEFGAFDLTTNFDLDSTTNALYKLNSIYGGVIVPRGCSIIGMDPRKTRIRPKYVPNPENVSIERSAIFRVTGACYFSAFAILDANPNGTAYKDYTTNIFVPRFSHHKLTTFEYADGVNNVDIDDDFISGANGEFARTDLDMYYEKVGLAYGPASGRQIEPDYPAAGLDIEPKVDEYRIVGSRGKQVGITSIRAGDGTTSTTTVTITLDEVATDFDVDTAIEVEGVGSDGYDGQFVVFNKVDSTNIQYKVQNAPVVALPTITNATVNVTVDTVTSSSPYIFNCMQKSVYGMNGLFADGSKATGFKSMVMAQYTGIGLQKDNNAFVKYNETTGVYEDSTLVSNLHSDSNARFKPEYENYHIKASNDAVLQLASIFAIGYANHFVADDGGDMSITNSNSNFGSIALRSGGFRKKSFARDDIGYVSHIIPPKEIDTSDTSIEFKSLDVNKIVGIADTSKLFLYGETNEKNVPDSLIDGFRLGAKKDEQLNVLIADSSGVSNTYSARVIMPNTQYTSKETSFAKIFDIGRSASGINSVTNNAVNFTVAHSFLEGETVRVLSQNGHLPDGLTHNTVYYAIPDSSDTHKIKFGQTFNDALDGNPITINNNGGILTVESRVSDKVSGEIGHPVQYDSSHSQWYVNVATAATENTIYNTVVGLGSTALGEATPRSFIDRKPDTRNLLDTIYRHRYVIPKDSSTIAREPVDGYVIEQSNASIGSTDTEVAYLYNPSNVSLTNSTQLRNPRLVADASWDTGVASIVTEIPHNLTSGATVEIVNIKSSNNTTGVANSAYNGTFEVAGITSAKQFTLAISNNPGTFTNDTSDRTTSLPNFKEKKTSGTYIIYRSEDVQEYIPQKQDGIYYLTVVNTSNAPTVSPFSTERFSQPVQNLYPQTNRDNPVSDPKAAQSFALSDTIGHVEINEPQNSLTKEAATDRIIDTNVGFGLTQLTSNAAGTTHTLYSDIDHGLNRITGLQVAAGGGNYVNGNYYNVPLVSFGSSVTGKHATARVTIAGGSVSAVKIIDGGSAYGIGNTLAMVGIATVGGHDAGHLKVTDIYNNVGDTLSIDNINPDSYDAYNNLYRITGITDGNDKEISVASASTISPAYTSGIGVTVSATANVILTGKTLNVDNIVYNSTVGLATVVTVQPHSFSVNDKVNIGGANDNVFNGGFIVKEVVGLTSFVADVGSNTYIPSTAGTKFVYNPYFTSRGGNLTKSDEKDSGRLMSQYAGISTITNASITPTANSVGIQSATLLDFNIGDYIQIDNEILRIRSTVSSTSVNVYRGLLGTDSEAHSNGAVVNRIKPNPIEFRRTSLLRASGHTFEYVGYGPGNYSTALPERQNRNLAPKERILAQSTKTEGGSVNYTGMDDEGDLFTRNKVSISITGEEEVFGTPIPTVTGEDPDLGSGSNVGFGLITPQEISVGRAIRVEGGSDTNFASEFDGPVIFNNKITSTSTKGIEANSLFLQGDRTVSRKFTVGISTPVLAGNVGDIVYNGQAAAGGLIGWVYSSNNKWEKFGRIGLDGAEPGQTIGISSDSNYVGLATNINIVGAGVSVTSELDATAGIATFTLDANPRLGISTGSVSGQNNLLGIGTQINFVGYGITVGGEFDSNTGIGTIILTGLSGVSTSFPQGPINAVQYNASGSFAGGSGFTYDNSNVVISGNTANSLVSISQTGGGNALEVTGKVGIGTEATAKLDIVNDSGESIRVKSTSGSGNIVRVDNTTGDTTPVIIDVNGNVGINTVQANAAAHVVGDVMISGRGRFLNPQKTYLVSLQAPDILTSDVTFKLPNQVGAASSVLYTTGSGVLDWISPTNIVSGVITNTDSIAEGSTNLYYTDERTQDAIGAAVEAGIQTGITVSYNDGGNALNFNVDSASPYPFTTKGFSIPL